VCPYCGPRKNDPSLLQRAMEAIRSEISCVMRMVKEERCEPDYIIDASQEEALCALRAMMAADAAAEARERARTGGAGHSIWELRGVWMGQGVCENKTMDDFLLAFVMWGKEVGSAGGGAEGASEFLVHRTALSPRSVSRCTARYNISKAMRRLQNFALFQEECYERFLQDPVTIEELDPCVYYQQGARCIGTLALPVARGPQGHRIMEIAYDLAQPSAAASSRADLATSRANFRKWFGLTLLLSFDDVATSDGLIWRENLDKCSLLDMLQMATMGSGSEYQECHHLMWCCSPVRIQHVDVSLGPVSWYTEWICKVLRGYEYAVGKGGVGVSASATTGDSLKSLDGAANDAPGPASKMALVSEKGGVGVHSSRVGVLTDVRGSGVADYARHVVGARGRCRW
jgi:hypothetical protein